MSLVRHYLAFVTSSDAQQVACLVTLLHESMHECYIGYERRHCGPPKGCCQLCKVLLEQFGSNVKLEGAQSTLMTISLGKQFVCKYVSPFKTLLGRLDSYDKNAMLNQFIFGLQLELARSVSLHLEVGKQSATITVHVHSALRTRCGVLPTGTNAVHCVADGEIGKTRKTRKKCRRYQRSVLAARNCHLWTL